MKLHFNEVNELFISFADHVHLVEEYNDRRNANLACKKDVFFCLRHRTVCCSNDENRSVHLSSTGNHVLYVVSVAWAVYVCIVAVCCFILNVS